MDALTGRIINDLNIKKQAAELGLPVWQAPSFLFMLMGAIIVFIMTVVYFISQKYETPELVIVSEVVVVLVLFTVGNFIIQSIEQMAKVNKMKSEFVSIASHQLKTPLAEINWEIELLLSKNKGGLTDKHLELIRRISNANERMARLVNDLLDVARIESGNLALVREKFNLADIVGKIIENYSVLARANNVEINFAKPSGDLTVQADRRKIGVAFDNLLSNAIKYIRRKGQVRISIARKNREIVVSVKDNGIGIPVRQQENVFEKFFRSDNASRFQVGGTGLGLFIAKNIIESSGGKIWFRSVENQGSEFCFSLPVEVNH